MVLAIEEVPGAYEDGIKVIMHLVVASDTLSIACVIVRDDLSQLDEVKERESEVLDLKWLSISKVSFTITYIVLKVSLKPAAYTFAR